MYARLSFCTACRASDTLNFRWKDILGVSSITIIEQKLKNTSNSIQPFCAKSFNELWHLLECPDKNDYIMASPQGDKPITIQYVNMKLKEFKCKYRLHIDNFPLTHSAKLLVGMSMTQVDTVRKAWFYLTRFSITVPFRLLKHISELPKKRLPVYMPLSAFNQRQFNWSTHSCALS